MNSAAPSRLGFARTIAALSGFLVGLLALQAGATYLPNRGVAGSVRDAVEEARGRDVPADRIGQATAGYYERLLNGSSEAPDPSLLIQLWQGKRAPLPNPYVRDEFLIYKPAPSLELDTSQDGNFESDSNGLIDREYSLSKPPGVVRIALLGDSLSRGRGLADPNRERFEAILENRLTADPGRNRQVQILNFSVTGYRPTQMYYVGTEKAPRYRPDLSLFTITPLGLAPGATDHLSRVVHEGVTPPYDFMRKVIQTAGVTRRASLKATETQLSPYRFELLWEILFRLKLQARRQGAVFAVVLLPAAEVRSVTAKRFQGIRSLVEEVGIPIIDLLDTFDGVENIEKLRLTWSDVHPNAAGHRLLADKLYDRLRRQPQVWSVLRDTERATTARQ